MTNIMHSLLRKKNQVIELKSQIYDHGNNDINLLVKIGNIDHMVIKFMKKKSIFSDLWDSIFHEDDEYGKKMYFS